MLHSPVMQEENHVIPNITIETESRSRIERGFWLAVAAYLLWGLLPIYWKQLDHIPALELVCHRIVWSFFFLALIVTLTNQWKSLIGNTFSKPALISYSIAACLIGMNWLTYVWAINSGFIVETSLGYFINPLLSVVLGVLFLGERLRRLQLYAVILAGSGVLFLTIAHGSPPWIALFLASSFAVYGLVKKRAPMNSIQGLTVETAILFLPALGYLLYRMRSGSDAFLGGSFTQDILLVCAGPVTSIPLLLFAGAARRISLTLVGIIQYVSPTMTFLIGITLYDEPFSQTKLIGFSAVWVALIVISFDGIRNQIRSNHH